MNDNVATYQLMELDQELGYKPVKQWPEWNEFVAYAQTHLSQLDNSCIVIQQGEQTKALYAPQALFDCLYRAEHFSSADLLDKAEAIKEFHHDLDYAQSYGRWLSEQHLHDHTVPESVLGWLVENGTAVYLWSISQLSIEHLSQDGIDLKQVAARLDDMDSKLSQERGFGLTAAEMTSFLKHSVQHLLQGQSLSDCRELIPDQFQPRYAELDAQAFELMRDYTLERFERASYKTMDSDGYPVMEEFFLGEGAISPMEDQPLILSAVEWHQLCALHTELLHYREVPEHVFNERDFWFPVEDLVHKGEYLMGDERYGDHFDEHEVFVHMPDQWRYTPEVAQALLKSGSVTPSFFGKELALQAYMQFEPEKYPLIPENYRALSELAPLAERAVRDDPYIVNDVPDKQLSGDMLREVIPQDLSLLRRFPEALVKGVPGIEDTLVQVLRNFDKQMNPSGADRFADQGSRELAGEYAKAVALKQIPESLRTIRVCQEALRLHEENSRFVPEKIKQTLERSSESQRKVSGGRKR